MNAALLGALLLVVSLISVTIYMYAWGRILTGPHRPGLARTAACRLFAAFLYVGVGLLTVETHDQGPLVGLAVFTVVQWIWWANAFADLRLTRQVRNDMADLFNHGYTDPVPNTAQPLNDAVVSAEIDRLSTAQNTMQQTVDDIATEVNANSASRRYAIAGIIFTLTVAIAGLIFGLVVFNRADRADALSQENARILAELKATQNTLTISVHEQCGLDALILGTYNVRARGLYALGPDAYDEGFRKVLASSQHQQCGIPTPEGLK